MNEKSIIKIIMLATLFIFICVALCGNIDHAKPSVA